MGSKTIDLEIGLGEAARRAETSVANLRGAVHRGSLKARKVGRDWLVFESEVDRYMRENRRGVARGPSPA